MRALQLTGPGELEVREVAVPNIGPTEVLVKVGGAGVCHSDLHLVQLQIPWPNALTLGHETAGWAAAVGSDVVYVKEGDPVLVYLVWSCGRCRPCLEGRDNCCQTTGGRLGLPPCPGLGPHGGMAEYIAVDARYLEPLGTLDPVSAAPLADAGLTPMHAINGARHRLTPGSTAVVMGVGGLGHVGLQVLRATSSVRVVAVDTSPAKRELATALGADHVLDADDHAAAAILDLTGGYGADAVFDFVGAQATVDLATRVVAPDGALRFVGVAGGGFTFRADTLPEPLPWGVDVRRSYGGTRRDQRQVLELARQELVRVDVHRYALDDGLSAFDDLHHGRIPGRAVLVP
ncbi:NAD(P)-dependent alcohol dehydrogenase [Mycobacterium sp. UM_CSW]|uniref:NAD(P)-dependent alcohol dehydrogenase n=1 Tax=Mycobacterium sp. UM_CSW TaxID=1370119 RepID=UPI00082DAEAB|nr:NAD(P)-dependent alcohol dehydrogenase [Mycobacterium sp. UM_CSW]